jgi:hypothetical protein
VPADPSGTVLSGAKTCDARYLRRGCGQEPDAWNMRALFTHALYCREPKSGGPSSPAGGAGVAPCRNPAIQHFVRADMEPMSALLTNRLRPSLGHHASMRPGTVCALPSRK